MLFLLLPVGVDYETRRWPIITFSLMGLCALMHLWSMILFFSDATSYLRWMNQFWFTPSDFSIFTIFTSLFVHADIFHLLGNMLYLFLFGATTEDMIGRGRFLALYLVGGVVSVFAHVALTAEHFASEIPLGGASGAISTCMGAFLLLLPKSNIEFRFFGLFFFRPFSKEFFLRGWVVMSAWFLWDLLFAVLEFAGISEGDGTALGAHVGGFAFGMAALGLLNLCGKPHAAEEQAEESPRQAPIRIDLQKTSVDRPYLIYQNEQQFGPYSPAEVDQYLKDGSILPEALFWREGLADWRPVSELPDAVFA